MTHANDNRPASFDAAILAYLPALKKLARRLRPLNKDDEREELVQATIVKALDWWQKYRTDKSPYTWLQFLMRGISRDEMERSNKQYAAFAAVRPIERTTPPNQEHAAALSMALRSIRPDLRSDMLALAEGGDFRAVGGLRGVSKQRVEQIVKRERERLESLERQADTRRDIAYGRAA